MGGRALSDITIEKYIDKQVCSLREAAEKEIAALERTLTSRLDAAQRAVEKAEHSVDLRLAGMNEFRSALTDQAATFLTRQESDIWRSNLLEKVHSLETRLDKAEGRGGGMQALWGWIIAGVLLLLALIEKWGG